MEGFLYQAHSQSVPFYVESQSICINHNFIEDSFTGTIVCTECGLVDDMKPISHKLSYKKDFPQSGYQVNSKKSSVAIHSNLKRALKLDTNLKWTKRRLIIGEKEIKRIVSINDINKNIENKAIYIMKKCLNHSAFRGQYICLIAETCVYYAAKYLNYPCSLEDFINEKKYAVNLGLKYYAKIIQTLRLPAPTANPYSLLIKFSSKLDLNQEVIIAAQKIMKLYMEKHFGGGIQMKGIVGGVLYISCLMKRIPRSQQAISTAIGISEITIRARFREIQQICRKYPADF